MTDNIKQYFLISEEELRDILKSIAKTAVDETDPIIEDSIFAFKLSKPEGKVIEIISKVFDEMIDDCDEYNWIGEEAIAKTLRDYKKYLLKQLQIDK